MQQPVAVGPHAHSRNPHAAKSNEEAGPAAPGDHHPTEAPPRSGAQAQGAGSAPRIYWGRAGPARAQPPRVAGGTAPPDVAVALPPRGRKDNGKERERELKGGKGLPNAVSSQFFYLLFAPVVLPVFLKFPFGFRH